MAKAALKKEAETKASAIKTPGPGDDWLIVARCHLEANTPYYYLARKNGARKTYDVTELYPRAHERVGRFASIDAAIEVIEDALNDPEDP